MNVSFLFKIGSVWLHIIAALDKKPCVCFSYNFHKIDFIERFENFYTIILQNLNILDSISQITESATLIHGINLIKFRLAAEQSQHSLFAQNIETTIRKT